MKSFKPRQASCNPSGGAKPSGGQSGNGDGRNAEAEFHDEKRSNATHSSATDPEAKLYRRESGKEAKLYFIGHGLMENRNFLLVDACLTQADGHAGGSRRCT